MKKGRLQRLARLSSMAAGLAGDAAGAVVGQGSEAFHRQAAARLTAVLGELKGLPHKAGQLLSVLDDALPAEHRHLYAKALSGLQAQAEPVPWAELTPVIEQDLGRSAAELFAEVAPQPAGAASIGQVHRARLHDGLEVAVKVQYPGVARALESDLANIGALVGAMSAVLPRTSVEHLLEDVAGRFEEELDYRHEAQVQLAFCERWRVHARLRVPEVLPELCGERVLVSEWVSGADFEQARRQPAQERGAWAADIWAFLWRSVLDDGWLHGDPHPGNFVFEPRGLAVLDFGCTQQLDAATVSGLATLGRLAIDQAPDDALFPPLAQALGLSPDFDPKLRPHLVGFARLLMAPVAQAQPFHFDRAYSTQLMTSALEVKAVMAKRALSRGMPTPQADGAVLLMRTTIGTAAVLARLDARADFREAAGLRAALTAGQQG